MILARQNLAYRKNKTVLKLRTVFHIHVYQLIRSIHVFGIDLCHSSTHFCSHTATHIKISGHSKILEPRLSNLAHINQKITSSSLVLRSQTHTSYITWLYRPCAIKFSRTRVAFTNCVQQLSSYCQVPRFHTFSGVIFSHRIKSH